MQKIRMLASSLLLLGVLLLGAMDTEDNEKEGTIEEFVQCRELLKRVRKNNGQHNPCFGSFGKKRNCSNVLQKCCRRFRLELDPHLDSGTW